MFTEYTYFQQQQIITLLTLFSSFTTKQTTSVKSVTCLYFAVNIARMFTILPKGLNALWKWFNFMRLYTKKISNE